MEVKLLNEYLALAAFRVVSVVLTASWFVPDEVYQSTEVAHRLVFGTGHLSWEWTHALRSYLHPVLTAAPLWLLKAAGLDTRLAVYHVPRIIHALIFALGDFSFRRLCTRLCVTSRIANLSFFVYMTSWFAFYCAPRTLSNSLETSLTLIALTWFPFEYPTENSFYYPYVAIGAFAIVLRPTAVLLWVVFGVYHLSFLRDPVRTFVYEVLPFSLPFFAITTAIDYVLYGRFTVPLWNFAKFNVVNGGSALFGVHPWYWYITEGLPSTMTLQLIPIAVGLVYGGVLRPKLLPFWASLFYVAVHSLLAHKEQRFLLPVIPLLCLYAGVAFNRMARLNDWKLYVPATILVVTNVAIAFFAGQLHQVGPLAVGELIVRHAHDAGRPLSVAALTPCYTMPGHAFFHNDVSTLRQLDCSPDVQGLREAEGLDEADLFHANATRWLIDDFNLELAARKYDRIVMYQKTYLGVAEWFAKRAYAVCENVFHSFVLTSSREDNYMVVLCASASSGDCRDNIVEL